MTLVVARQTPVGIRMESDIRVVRADDVRRGFPYAVLKAVITQPHICVAFSGSVEPGLDGIREVREVGDSASVAVQLAPLTRRADVEFLVADSARPRIRVIRSGAIELSGWIGDFRAFERFQQAYAATKPIPSDDRDREPEERRADFEVAERMHQAFGEVVDDDAITTVGEASISLLTNGGVFEYAPVVRAVMSHRQTVPSHTWTTLQFGTAAQGGFLYNVLTPDRPGVGAVGIHFHQGRLGLLYAPLLLDGPESYSSVTQQEFQQQVEERRAIKLKSAFSIG